METVASYEDRILDQLLPGLLAEPWQPGISSNVDVCEKRNTTRNSSDKIV